ncbi:hypothetical protein AB6A40_003770 [Gnathostoma spinigerum]|uniref:Uncharacterized protein n=1 Tax=Gnathostoma spinigerum TaxID=75299 RepID=A0ABD6EBN4_9BILA
MLLGRITASAFFHLESNTRQQNVITILCCLAVLACAVTIFMIYSETLEKQLYELAKSRPVKLRLTRDFLANIRPPKRLRQNAQEADHKGEHRELNTKDAPGGKSDDNSDDGGTNLFSVQQTAKPGEKVPKLDDYIVTEETQQDTNSLKANGTRRKEEHKKSTKEQKSTVKSVSSKTRMHSLPLSETQRSSIHVKIDSPPSEYMY